MGLSPTEQLVEAFLSRTLPKEEWTHHAHLKVGLWHLLRYSPSESLKKVRQRISAYNVSTGVENTESGGYHETITRFYLGFIDQFLQEADRSYSIDQLADALIAQHGDKSLPFNYYSRERLMSKSARLGWVEPDLRPFQNCDDL